MTNFFGKLLPLRSGNQDHNWHIRDLLIISLTSIITILCAIEIFNAVALRSTTFSYNSVTNEDENRRRYSIAIGIISVHRPDGPDYVYYEVLSILDTLFTNQKYIKVDKVHVFDGSFNGSQVKYFKYSPHVKVHSMNREAFKLVEHFSVHRKATLNYLLALKYLVPAYGANVDAYLMLEDDVLFDPHAARIMWQVLNAVKPNKLFLVDGYVKNGKWSELAVAMSPVVRFQGDARCCSQAFLMSPEAVRQAIPLLEMSLNGSAIYLPLDVYLTTSLLKLKDFHFYFASTCWVQHIGYPVMGLGIFHRGCSMMNFDDYGSNAKNQSGPRRLKSNN